MINRRKFLPQDLVSAWHVSPIKHFQHIRVLVHAFEFDCLFVSTSLGVSTVYTVLPHASIILIHIYTWPNLHVDTHINVHIFVFAQYTFT